MPCRFWMSEANVTQVLPVCPSVASPGSMRQHLFAGPSCTSGWPKWSTASESVPVNATQGLPSDPVVAVSLLLVNGMPESGGTLSPVAHRPPEAGLVASKVPLGSLVEFLMPFQTVARPAGVTVASGSVARKNRLMVARLPTLPPRPTGKSTML